MLVVVGTSGWLLLLLDARLLPDGNIFLFQLLWKGTTDVCHLKMSPAVALHHSSLIVHGHTTHSFHPTPSQATVAQEILLNFEAGLFRSAALKIVWEMSHEFETRNIPRRKIPAAKFPPPHCKRSPEGP